MDVQRMRKSFDKVASFGDEVPLFFYSHLFLSHPETRAMFPGSMMQQRDRLFRALGDQAGTRTERHDFTVGGRSEYVMTGPNGEQSRGFWEFLSIDQPRAFEVKDGFLGSDGKQAPDMPTMRMRFTFEPHDGGTRMVTMTTFPSLEALERLLGMGMEEGMKAAMAQIDGVLAA